MAVGMMRRVGGIQMAPAEFAVVRPEEMIDVQTADSVLSPGTHLPVRCATFAERCFALNVDLETHNSCGTSFGCIFLD